MQRSTIYLLGVLVLLILGAILLLRRPGEQSVEATAGELLVQIDSAKVTGIELRSPTETVRLERRGIDWYVAAPVEDRANAANVGSLLERSKDLRVKGVMSRKAEKHALFQVDSTGTSVTLTEDGGRSVSFIVGKGSESYTETFMRKAGSDDVAMVDGAFGWVFTRSARDWRDHTILKLVRDSVRTIAYQYGDTVFTVAFRDSVWTIGGKSAKKSVVDGVLSSLASLQCDDFADNVTTAKVSALVTVDGMQVRFSYDKTAKRYLVQTSSNPRWYILESWRADGILKRRKDLL